MTEMERRLKVEEVRKNELVLSILKSEKKSQVARLAITAIVSAILTIAILSGRINKLSWIVVIGSVSFCGFTLYEMIGTTRKILNCEKIISADNMELAVYEENEREKAKRKIK